MEFDQYSTYCAVKIRAPCQDRICKREKKADKPKKLYVMGYRMCSTQHCASLLLVVLHKTSADKCKTALLPLNVTLTCAVTIWTICRLLGIYCRIDNFKTIKKKKKKKSPTHPMCMSMFSVLELYFIREGNWRLSPPSAVTQFHFILTTG